jgi:hypothetical protein
MGQRILLCTTTPRCLTRQEADFIRHECGCKQASAKAASQAESKIVDSSDDEFSPM